MSQPRAMGPPPAGGSPAPGWYPDAYGRHELRRWDGGWGTEVVDGAVVGEDPPPGNPKEPPFWDGSRWRQRTAADYARQAATTAPGGTDRRRNRRGANGRRSSRPGDTTWSDRIFAICFVLGAIAAGCFVAIVLLWPEPVTTADITDSGSTLDLVGAPGQEVDFELKGPTSVQGKWAAPDGLEVTLDGTAYEVVPPKDETWSSEIEGWKDLTIPGVLLVPDVAEGTELQGELTGHIRYPGGSGTVGTFEIAGTDLDLPVEVRVVTQGEADRVQRERAGIRPQLLVATGVGALVFGGVVVVMLALALRRE